MSGSASASVFCVIYAHVARRSRWPAALALGLLGFLGMTLIWKQITLPVLPLYLLILAVIGIALRVAPRPQAAQAVVGATVTVWPLCLVYTLASLAAMLINGALFNLARR